MTVSLDVFGNFLRLFWDFQISTIQLNLFESIESIWINWIILNQLNHLKMIESIWNNIQINWLQSRNNKNNNNNNFQTCESLSRSNIFNLKMIFSKYLWISCIWTIIAFQREFYSSLFLGSHILEIQRWWWRTNWICICLRIPNQVRSLIGCDL